MQACVKCLDNAWGFKYIEGWVTANCQMCGHEVMFEAKKKKRFGNPQPSLKYRGQQKHIARKALTNPPITNAYLNQDPGDDGIPPWT